MMKTKTVLSIAGACAFTILALLAFSAKYEQTHYDDWAEAQALRIKQDCLADGGTWIIRPSYTDNKGRYFTRREWCDVGHIGIPTQ